MRSIEEIKDEVCFRNGFINWEDYLNKVKLGLGDRYVIETNNIVDQIAKEYAKDNEQYFECDKCDDCVDEHDTVECPDCYHHFQIYEGL